MVEERTLRRADMHVHLGSQEYILDGTRRKGRLMETICDYFVDKVRRNTGNPPIKNYQLFYKLGLDLRNLCGLADMAGIDYIAVTDHDTIDPVMVQLDEYPELFPKVIIGEEVSTGFKDRDYVLHVGVYNLNEEQHKAMREAKADLEGELIPYLNEQNLRYSLHHPFVVPWAKKGAVATKGDMEKLRNMFALVEKRNGNVGKKFNIMAEKFFNANHATAGSDTHNGSVGRDYVEALAGDKEDFLDEVWKGHGRVCGKHESVRNFTAEVVDKPSSYGRVLYWRDGTEEDDSERVAAERTRFGQTVVIADDGKKIIRVPILPEWQKFERGVARFIKTTAPMWAIYHMFFFNSGVEE